MAPMVKIDPKYDALGSKTRVASRGNPQMTALQLIIHYQVKIAKKHNTQDLGHIYEMY